jgi:large subunit ribosomal protein L9
MLFPSAEALHGDQKGQAVGFTPVCRGLRKMKIILKENIENLGKRGDVIQVANGYGRNYLIPRKLALQVTPSNMKMVEMEQKAQRKKLEQEVKSFQGVIDQLNQTAISFERKAGDKDVIFGSVSTSDIKEALEKLGIEVEKKKIMLPEPIKRLGNYTIAVKVFHDEKAEIKIEVKKEGAEDESKEVAASEKKAKEEREDRPVRPEEELEKKGETSLDKAGAQDIPEQEISEEKIEEPEGDKESVPQIKAEESKEEITEETKKT